jgi:hypothetical protein
MPAWKLVFAELRLSVTALFLFITAWHNTVSKVEAQAWTDR